MLSYTAKCTTTDDGYMGQIIEWPEVVSEGKDVEEGRFMLKDALQEMVLAYRQQQRELPLAGGFIEQVPVEANLVSKTP